MRLAGAPFADVEAGAPFADDADMRFEGVVMGTYLRMRTVHFDYQAIVKTYTTLHSATKSPHNAQQQQK